MSRTEVSSKRTQPPWHPPAPVAVAPVLIQSRLREWAPMIAIVAGVLIAYANCYRGVFLLDDSRSIHENVYIQDLTRPWQCLFAGINVSRPIVSLSLAINFAIGDYNPIGYHIFNVLIHLLAGLALFGVFRRTLLKTRYVADAPLLASAVALLWSVHPLQTQSVTYIIQRSEAMMGLFLLLTLYCFIRATETPAARPRLWMLLSVLCCALGMACKQSMFAAPLLVLLYDRTFAAGSFAGALRQRWLAHAAFFGTWGVLLFTIIQTPSLLGAGFGQSSITPLQYLLSQAGVLLHYLQLSLWPAQLCLDYWWPVAASARDIIPGGIVILTLLSLTAWSLVRRPAWGFVGAWFFLILAPSSSFMPIVDLAFEQRMYLSLASVLCVIVFVLFEACRRLNLRTTTAFAGITCCIAAGLCWRTFDRNSDYDSQISMWGSVIAQRPDNPRARNNYGLGLFHEQRLDQAESQYLAALKLDPTYWQSMYNLALVYDAREQYERAIEFYTLTLKHNDYPNAYGALAKAHNNVGLAFRAKAQLEAAEKEFRAALTHDPKFWPARFNLGLVRAQRGDARGALAEYAETLRLNPDYPEAHRQIGFGELELGNELMKAGQWDEAASHLKEAARLLPNDKSAAAALAELTSKRMELDRQQAALLDKVRAAMSALKGDPKKEELKLAAVDASNQLGLLLRARGQLQQAEAPLLQALDIKPDYWPAHYNLGLVLESSGKLDAALSRYRETLRLNPGYDPAKYFLANGLNNQGLALRAEQKAAAAEALFREACHVHPDFWQARYNLGLVLETQGRNEAAMDAYQETLRVNPGYAPAKARIENLTTISPSGK